MCNCPDHYGSRIVIINLDFPLYPRMNERFKLHISSSVTVHQTQYFCRCYSKGSFHLNVYTFLTGRVSSRTQDQFKEKVQNQSRHFLFGQTSKTQQPDADTIFPFVSLTKWAGGQTAVYFSLPHCLFGCLWDTKQVICRWRRFVQPRASTAT